MDTAKQGFAQGNRPVHWQGAVAAVLKRADVPALLDLVQAREQDSTSVPVTGSQGTGMRPPVTRGTARSRPATSYSVTSYR